MVENVDITLATYLGTPATSELGQIETTSGWQDYRSNTISEQSQQPYAMLAGEHQSLSL